MQHLKEDCLIKPKSSFFADYPSIEKHEFLKIKAWKSEYKSIMCELVDDDEKMVFVGWMDDEKFKYYFHVDINDKIANVIVGQSFIKFVGTTPDGQTATVEM